MTHQKACDILGVPNTATETEIRSAYRDLVKVWHPDRWGHDLPLQARAQDKLKEINVAYELLLSGAQRVPPGPPTSNSTGPQQDQPSGRERSDNVPPRPSREANARQGRIFIVSIGFALLLTVAIIQSNRKVEIPTTAQYTSPSPVPSPETRNTVDAGLRFKVEGYGIIELPEHYTEAQFDAAIAAARRLQQPLKQFNVKGYGIVDLPETYTREQAEAALAAARRLQPPLTRVKVEGYGIIEIPEHFTEAHLDAALAAARRLQPPRSLVRKR